MKYDNLRLALFAKRKLLSKFGFKPNNTISLNRGEKPALLNTEFKNKAITLGLNNLITFKTNNITVL